MPESDLLPLLLALRSRAVPTGAYGVAGPLREQVYRSQGIPGPAQTDAGGMNLLPEAQRTPPSQWTSDPVFQLIAALRNPVTRVTPWGAQTEQQVLNDDLASHGGLLLGTTRTDRSDATADPRMNRLMPATNAATGDTFLTVVPGEESQGPPRGPTTLIADLIRQRQQQQDIAALLSRLGLGAPGAEQQNPGPGYIPGALHLNPDIAPQVPNGQARPFAPGEWVQNPNGSWSSEETMTVSGDPQFNGGKPTVLPSLWIRNGKAYVAHNEDEATALAKASGLTFPSFPDMTAAEKFANEREANWQKMKPTEAGQVAPLWNPESQYIEPPKAK